MLRSQVGIVRLPPLEVRSKTRTLAERPPARTKPRITAITGSGIASIWLPAPDASFELLQLILIPSSFVSFADCAKTRRQATSSVPPFSSCTARSSIWLTAACDTKSR